MPELPEVQAHAERLTAAFAGARLRRVEPLAFTALKTVQPAPEEAVGHQLERVDRRGKHLLLVFAPVTFVVHLMQGGRLRQDAGKTRRPRGGLLRWRFDDDRALLLTEAGTEHKAGVWVVSGDPLIQEPLAKLGQEADTVDADRLHELFATSPARLHTFLRDQSVLAGLGRRLANEVCHRARLSPFAQTAKLGTEDAARVADAIAACVAEGLADERGRDEMSASKDRPAAVHHREGQPCPVCGDEVRAVEYRAYTIDYCPTCQTGGRILADNTLSRLGIYPHEKDHRLGR